MAKYPEYSLKPEFVLVLTATILFWAWAFMGIKIALRELSPDWRIILELFPF